MCYVLHAHTRSKNMKEDPNSPRRRIIFQQCRVASEINDINNENYVAAEENLHKSFDNRVDCNELEENHHSTDSSAATSNDCQPPGKSLT